MMKTATVSVDSLSMQVRAVPFFEGVGMKQKIMIGGSKNDDRGAGEVD